MNADNESSAKNNLWRARKRAGLERKQVAFLLSKKSSDEISRYERNVYQPSLKTALKLAVIYRVPVNLLFQEIYEQFEQEIAAIRTKHSHLYPGGERLEGDPEQIERGGPYCFYAELLRGRVPSDLELRTIREHNSALDRAVGEYADDENLFE